VRLGRVGLGIHQSRPYVDGLSTTIVTPRTYPVTDAIALAAVEIFFIMCLVRKHIEV
jgi:hypothetical protein